MRYEYHNDRFQWEIKPQSTTNPIQPQTVFKHIPPVFPRFNAAIQRSSEEGRGVMGYLALRSLPAFVVILGGSLSSMDVLVGGGICWFLLNLAAACSNKKGSPCIPIGNKFRSFRYMTGLVSELIPGLTMSIVGGIRGTDSVLFAAGMLLLISAVLHLSADCVGCCQEEVSGEEQRSLLRP